MASLFINHQGEMCLTLRGAAEDRVLTTLRGWPHWSRADIERDPQNPGSYRAVTLITARVHETTIREILKRSFGMIFPSEGGNCAAEELPVTQRRGVRSAR
ncbi:MAG: hypothetical protein OHK0022_00130 [Roseiflexaceae bacterium]